MKRAETGQTRSPARRAAELGLWMALAIVISTLEEFLPTIPVPGAKPGLSNIVTMLVLSVDGLPAAMLVTGGKAVFALFRGGTAFVLSLAGGVCSTLLMVLCRRLFGRYVSYVGIGVAGAVAHNLAQWGVAMLMMSSSLLYYAPWLLLTATVAGTVTGLVLNIAMPALERLPVWGRAGIHRKAGYEP